MVVLSPCRHGAKQGKTDCYARSEPLENRTDKVNKKKERIGKNGENQLSGGDCVVFASNQVAVFSITPPHHHSLDCCVLPASASLCAAFAPFRPGELV